MQLKTQEQHFKETFEQKIKLKYIYTQKHNKVQRTNCQMNQQWMKTSPCRSKRNPNKDESLQRGNPNEDESLQKKWGRS